MVPDPGEGGRPDFVTGFLLLQRFKNPDTANSRWQYPGLLIAEIELHVISHVAAHLAAKYPIRPHHVKHDNG